MLGPPPPPEPQPSPDPSPSAGLYERYERQLLQASLDEMKDVVWCPRCQYPAMLQEGEPGRQGGLLATCGKCGFAFCSECRLECNRWNRCSVCRLERCRTVT